jgi:hypothetical protein
MSLVPPDGHAARIPEQIETRTYLMEELSSATFKLAGKKRPEGGLFLGVSLLIMIPSRSGGPARVTVRVGSVSPMPCIPSAAAAVTQLSGCLA